MPNVGSTFNAVIYAQAPAGWVALDQVVFISTAGYFMVTAIMNPLSITLQNLGYIGNASPTTVFGSGLTMSPGGVSIVPPIPVADGGTNSTTKAGAQTNLGLGQAAQISTASGLTQAITASFVQVGAIAVTIPASGSWLLAGNVRVSFNGTTFASSRSITAKIRNITQGVDYASTIGKTEVQTTTSFPDHDYNIPFLLTGGPVAADVLQILITIDVINSAGTLNVTGGSLVAIPLNLS